MPETLAYSTIPGGRKAKKRRWRIPPPLLKDRDAPGPEGLYVLEDFPDERGMVLWKSLRSTLLWADVESGNRKELFPKELAATRTKEVESRIPKGQADLRRDLLALVTVLKDPSGAKADPIGAACHRIGEWAAEQGATQSAIEFYQAASLACPDDSDYALAVATAAREAGQFARAEAWYHRAIGLSRQGDDWDTYIRAYMAHGRMLAERGALPAAERSFVKAQRRASRQGLREEEAVAYHELFRLALENGDFDDAIYRADRAARAYGPRHPDLPALARDVAVAWMERGEPGRAVPVLKAALEKVAAEDRPALVSALARAESATSGRRAKPPARELDDELVRRLVSAFRTGRRTRTRRRP